MGCTAEYAIAAPSSFHSQLISILVVFSYITVPAAGENVHSDVMSFSVLSENLTLTTIPAVVSVSPALYDVLFGAVAT